MHIIEAKIKDKHRWDNYVLTHPEGIAYQFFAWKEAVEAAYGFTTYYLMAEINNKIKGVLPLVILKTPLLPNTLVSLPYCDAGGPLANDPFIEKELIRHAVALSGNFHSKKLEIRSAHEIADFDPSKTMNHEKARMILKFPNNSGKLLSSLKAKVRSQVKKAYKNGLFSKAGSINLLDDFYTVFTENMRDLGSPVHSKKWIRSILKFYKNRAHLVIVYMPDGTPAAAGIILCHPNCVSVPWASSLRRFNPWNPNMLLYWSFLKYSSDNGYPTFDFGRSTPGEGTYRFKKQWGAVPEYLHWVKVNGIRKNALEYGNTSSGRSGSGNARETAENIIRKLPVSIANTLGHATRKYISL